MTTRVRVELRDPFTRHCDLVDTVDTIAPPPAQWTELRNRYDAFVDFDATPCLDRLITAVVDGGTEDIPTLKALATSESAHERSDVIIAVRSATYARLVQLYSDVAAANYAKVGKAFDSAAAKFTSAAQCGDPEADGESIVGEPDSVRSGWLDAGRTQPGDADPVRRRRARRNQHRA